jgi:hypothetical protein
MTGISFQERQKLMADIAPNTKVSIPYKFEDSNKVRSSLFLEIDGEYHYLGEIPKLVIDKCEPHWFFASCDVFVDTIGFQMIRMFSNHSRSVNLVLKASFGTTTSLIHSAHISEMYEQESTYSTKHHQRYHRVSFNVTSICPDIISHK